MISFFPEIHEDELLYSQLCRYYQRTGYTRFIFAADDLYLRRTVRPAIEWVNAFTPDAMEHITKHMDFETIILQHTMFPAYARFLSKERRARALHSLCICDGNYYNLIASQNAKQERFLRYCPACAAEDRKIYGETYWHRSHQVSHMRVCPEHGCYLRESTVPIRSSASPGFYPAETEVPLDMEAEPCHNGMLIEFSRYVLDIFRAPVDMEGDVPVGSYLHSMLDGKYLGASGVKANITELYGDYQIFIKNICEAIQLEAFKKIYNNYSFNHFRICQVAFFQGIPVENLVKHSAAVTSTAMEEFYKELAMRFGIGYSTIQDIGEAVITKYRTLGRLSRKSGPKQREWAALDEKYLPDIEKTVNRIYCHNGKPGRVSVNRVEREMGLPSKQMQNMPKCMRYVKEHLETQNEYRARQVTWAVAVFLREGRYLSRNKLNHFLYFRKNDLDACISYITDPDVKRIAKCLIAGETFQGGSDAQSRQFSPVEL